MRLSYIKKILLLCLSLLILNQTYAKDSTAQTTPLIQRVEKLLNNATKHIEQKGVSAVQDFSKDPQFVDHELYVYALNLKGDFLASGGDSAALSGSNVMDYPDANGKLFFHDMVEQAIKKPTGEIHYHWFNPGGGVSSKTTRYSRTGDLIIAVGYHAPRATSDNARTMLERAVQAWQDNPRAAQAAFNQLGKFKHDDLYVFVINRKTGKILINGNNPKMAGADGLKIHDEGGHYFIKKMIDMSNEQKDLTRVQTITYRWRNPLSETIERKNTQFRIEGDYLIGVGNYVREF